MRILISLLLFVAIAVAAPAVKISQNKGSKPVTQVNSTTEFPKPHEYAAYGSFDENGNFVPPPWLSTTTKRTIKPRFKILKDRNGRSYYKAADGKSYYVD